MSIGQPMWGMGSKTATLNPPKSFNIHTRSGVDQPLTCRMHPVAVLKILNSYVRRAEENERTIGTLVGCTEGSVVEITDSFPVTHRETMQDGVSVVQFDQDQHRKMLELHQKVFPRDQVVGWFSTGTEIGNSCIMIHKFYCDHSRFIPSHTLAGPVHVLVDTEPAMGRSMDVKAFVFTQTQPLVASNLLQFHQVPLEVKASSAEKAGISQMMQAKSSGDSKPIDSIDGFNLGLKELLKLFRRMQEYVKAVKDGKVEGDLAVGRGLTAQLSSEPVIATEAIENLCKTSLQDSLMVVYLASLLRTQISMAEKIQALYGDVALQAPAPTGNYTRSDRFVGGVCQQWQQTGSCSWGDNCKYSHA